MNVIQVERVADGQGDEGVARDEQVVRPIRLVGMLQHADPFGVAGFKGEISIRHSRVVHIRHDAVGVKMPVAVQVEVKTKIVRAVLRNEHRRARADLQTGVVAQTVVEIQRRGVRRDEQAEIVGIGRGEDAGHGLRLGIGKRGVGGKARGGGLAGGRHGTAFAAADGQERERHDECHGQQDERDDQRDAVFGVASDK